jgi:hypothetical protein
VSDDRIAAWFDAHTVAFEKHVGEIAHRRHR